MGINHKSLCMLMPSLANGGAERVGVTLLNEWHRRGYDVQLVLVASEQGKLVNELNPSVPITSLRSSRSLFAIFKIVKIIRSRNPDILFVNMSHLNLLIAIMRKILPRDTVIIARETSLLSEITKEYSFPGFWRFLICFFYNNLDYIVCQSEVMRSDLINSFGVKPTKLGVIRNPININNTRRKAHSGVARKKSSKRFNFVAVGNLYPRKNFGGLISAIAALGDTRVFLDIFGVGPEASKLNQLIQKLGLQNNIRLKGFIDNPFPKIAAADALILTSKYEGLPNVVLEALALQTPVIATPAGGVCNELLDDRYGCFVALDDLMRA